VLIASTCQTVGGNSEGQGVDVRLPPGQRVIDAFPRFGARLSRSAPAVPADPVINVRGVVREPFDLPLRALATLPRRKLPADFHCVTGWSAMNLHWEGVSFEAVYRTFIEPVLRPHASVHYIVFGGLDGWRSLAWSADVLADDVLIADRLDGRPLDGDHGAPARLVSPHQYGYISTKHLCRIEVHTVEPQGIQRTLLMRLLGPHPRARVWAEERHRYLPTWAVRRVYRASIPYLIARGGRAAPG
jgi:DMSO/TMAO reductase YedYZ molybdopterin-dependent catalytic subunit